MSEAYLMNKGQNAAPEQPLPLLDLSLAHHTHPVKNRGLPRSVLSYLC